MTFDLMSHDSNLIMSYYTSNISALSLVPSATCLKSKVALVNIPNYDASTGHIAGLFSLEPVAERQALE